MKNPPINNEEIANIVNGLIPQFTTNVNNTGLGLRPALTTAPKSIFTMIGYIMKNKQMAIGIETTGAPFTFNDKPSSHRASPGASSPRLMPATIHRATHVVR